MTVTNLVGIRRSESTCDTRDSLFHRFHHFLGSRGGVHFDLVDAARNGVLALRGWKDSTAAAMGDRHCPPPSVYCDDASHPRSFRLVRDIRVGSQVLNLWRNHDCLTCPSLCRCGGRDSAGRRIQVCGPCMSLSSRNRGLGYDNPLNRPVPPVRRLRYSTFRLCPVGSDIAAFNERVLRDVHSVISTHYSSRCSPDSGAEPRTFREFSGFPVPDTALKAPVSGLSTVVADPDSHAFRTLGPCDVETVSAINHELGFRVSHRKLPAPSDYTPPIGGLPRGPCSMYNLLNYLPTGCTDTSDPRGLRSSLRKLLARVLRRRESLGLWTTPLDLHPVSCSGRGQLSGLNDILRRYGVRISEFTFRLESVLIGVDPWSDSPPHLAVPKQSTDFVDYRTSASGRSVADVQADVETALATPLSDGQTHASVYSANLLRYLQTSQVSPSSFGPFSVGFRSPSNLFV